ncbi:MAG: hypothetical protein C0592_11150 [Marinilabiliales bacterium]|nr:MAG: hypothetical protein C0592_11150 [Marinilabiliales bacterium]
MNFYSEIAACIQNNKSAVLCVITQTEGSTPRKASSKMLVFPDGSISGTVGGGSIEKQCIEDALIMMNSDQPQHKLYNLANDLEMHCGGQMHVYFEPLVSAPQLIIFGAGHVGKALAKMATISGFRILAVDNREGIFDTWAGIPAETLCAPFEKAVNQIDFHKNAYIVSCTYKHAYDTDVISLCLPKEHKYIGMIGSKRKVDIARKDLKERFKFSEEEISGIDMPIGVPISCETPEDIAVSILAKLIDVRNTENQ